MSLVNEHLCAYVTKKQTQNTNTKKTKKTTIKRDKPENYNKYTNLLRNRMENIHLTCISVTHCTYVSLFLYY